MKEDFYSKFREVISNVFNFTIGLANAMIMIFGVMGSLASLMLLYYLFPKVFMSFVPAFMKVLVFIFQVVIVLIGCTIGLSIIYIFIKYVFVPLSIKQREINNKRRQLYRNELVKDIVSKLRRKRRL